MSHPYQCYSDIVSQADAWQEAIETVGGMSKSIKLFFDEMQPGEIVFTGCTSPYYAGCSSAFYWQSVTGIHTKAIPCSELIQFPSGCYSSRIGKPMLVVCSRSGKTTETLWAVEQFEHQFPGRTLSICCQPDSPLEEKAAVSIVLPKGREQTIPETRSFAAMYLAALMVGAIIGGDEKAFRELETAPAMIKGIIQGVEASIIEINKDRDFQNIFFLGSGPMFGIAREGALKMIEMALSYSLGVPFLESRHGPRAIIDDKSLVIGLNSRAGSGYEAKVMTELTSNHRATTVAVVPDPSWETGDCSYRLPVNCRWSDNILGLAYLPVIQLLAYYRALAKGTNPDISRNLTAYFQIERE